MKSLKTLLAKSSGEYSREEIESIEATKKNSRLQAELECKQDLIMQEESETFEIFSHLYHKRLDALYELDLKARKVAKLGVSRARIDEAKESSNLGQSSWWWN